MEPCGCDRLQPVANPLASRTAEAGETVAAGCDRLPETFHGKEGVDGSSPSEGSAKAPQSGASSFVFPCTIHSVRWVWSPLWSLQIEKCLRQRPKAATLPPRRSLRHDTFLQAAVLSRRRSQVRVPSLPSTNSVQIEDFPREQLSPLAPNGVMETFLEPWPSKFESGLPHACFWLANLNESPMGVAGRTS
jgi:hypothetical protein